MAGVVALLALCSAACGSVEVPATEVVGSEQKACERLVAALPGTVADQEQRETKGNPLGAAWGDPAIVLRCGVDKPADYDRFGGCQTVNGVDWYAPEADVADQSADAVLTTIGREPGVEVVVPPSYRPPVAVMVDLGKAIEAHTKVVRRCS
jgi:hypothetical protein